jgi:uncharacterized membrane protein YgaE (UPF0421/DUF939 family)
VGIAIVVASLAVGTGVTYSNSSNLGFFAYTPNLLVAMIGVIVAIIGAIVDPMIETKLRRPRETS